MSSTGETRPNRLIPPTTDASGTVSVTNAHLELASIPFKAVADHGFEQAPVRPRWGGVGAGRGERWCKGSGLDSPSTPFPPPPHLCLTSKSMI